MYGASATPGWQRDVIWTAGAILLVAAMITAAAVSWMRLSEEEAARPLLVEGLRATLVPGSGAEVAEGADAEGVDAVGADAVGAHAESPAPTLAVRAESGIVADEPFEALPGTGVRIAASEAPGFDVEAALNRIAGVWSEVLLGEGRTALLDTIDDPGLADQLTRLVDGPATELVDAGLAEELLASGLGDGSRLANWQLQAQQSPGEQVQPVVGVFVFFEASELQGLSDRQIGESVISQLAEITIEEGADEAREAITNVNLSARYEQGLSQARDALHDLFVAVGAGRSEEIETRLAEARAVQAGDEDEQPGLAGLLPAGDLAGLPADEANERILGALAERTWQDGPGVLDGLLSGDPRAERLAAARPWLASLSSAANARALRLAWSGGVLAVVAALLMVVLARGAGRFSRPGIALLLAAVPGTAIGWTLRRAAADASGAGLPGSAQAEGVAGAVWGLLRHVVGRLPEGAMQDVLLVHLVLAGAGVAALTVALLILLVGAVRPRRRGYL